MTISVKHIVYTCDLSVEIIDIMRDKVSLAIVQNGRHHERYYDMEPGDRISLDTIHCKIEANELEPPKEYWPRTRKGDEK